VRARTAAWFAMVLPAVQRCSKIGRSSATLSLPTAIEVFAVEVLLPSSWRIFGSLLRLLATGHKIGHTQKSARMGLSTRSRKEWLLR
jgi:hypothetical protein